MVTFNRSNHFFNKTCMRITLEEYLKAQKIVDQYNIEQRNPDDCVICGVYTKNNSYYAGDNPLCTQKCLSQWDEEHDTFV